MLKNIFKLFALSALVVVTLQANFTENQKIETSMNILKNSDIKIPSKILKNAQAIVIIPNLKKGGFLLNGSYGVGVLSIKNSDGSWSDPSFVTFKNLSFGLQAGVNSTDAIMIFETKRGLDGIEDGKATISYNVGVTIVKNGESVSRKTDGKLSANIYLFGKSSGLLLNFMSAGSGVLYVNDEMNDKYYDTLVNTQNLLSGYTQSHKKQVEEFKNILSNFVK